MKTTKEIAKKRGGRIESESLKPPPIQPTIPVSGPSDMKASESVMSDRLDELRRLLEALEMATGGSSSLDDEIGRLLDPIEHRHSGSHPLAGVSAQNDATPLFSSNIDVAIRFAMQMTGAQSWAISFGKCSKAEPFSVAFLYADETGEVLIAEGEATTPALAICAAMIHAEIEKQDR